MKLIKCDRCGKTIEVEHYQKGFVEIYILPGALGNQFYETKQVCPDCVKTEMAWVVADKPAPVLQDPWGTADEASGG